MDQNKNIRKKTQANTNSKSAKSLDLIKKKKYKEKKPKKKSEGNIVKKILSVTASIFLTLFLIGFITGTIVVGAFAIYIKNHIDPVIDDFDMISTDQKQSSRIY